MKSGHYWQVTDFGYTEVVFAAGIDSQIEVIK